MKRTTPTPRVSATYRTATFAFLGVVVLIAAAIAFVSFTKSTITVTLKDRSVSEALNLTVTPTPAQDTGELKGTVLTTSVEGNVTIDVPQNGATVDDYAHGLVTITNTWNQPQPLAATTRLKSLVNDMIYRTRTRVDVPVGGTVTVEVVADEVGARGNVAPGRFEIVALWPGLKEKIYGESAEPFTGGTRTSSQLAQATIDEATRTLEQQLLAKVPAHLPTIASDLTAVGSPLPVSTEYQPNAKAGDAVSSVTVAGSLTAAVVAVNTSLAQELISTTASNLLAKGETFRDGQPSASWRIITTHERNATAEVELTLSGAARLSPRSDVLAPARFVRMTADEITAKLAGTSGIASVTVRISPFWTTRTPSLPSQINVITTQADAQ